MNKDEYTKTGKALLLAEDILTASEYSSFLNNYQDSSIRIYLNKIKKEKKSKTKWI